MTKLETAAAQHLAEHRRLSGFSATDTATTERRGILRADTKPEPADSVVEFAALQERNERPGNREKPRAPFSRV